MVGRGSQHGVNNTLAPWVIIMRLFIAALIPENVLQELEEYINAIKEEIDGLKWEKPEKLHVTLKFLGNVKQAGVQEISSLIEDLVKEYSPFKTNLSELGGFPRLNNPRVLYVGLTENKQLTNFHLELDRGLSAIGFEREERKFVPHITIGRVKKRISFKKASEISNTSFAINRIGIIKSELRREGSVYTPIKIFNLGG